MIFKFFNAENAVDLISLAVFVISVIIIQRQLKLTTKAYQFDSIQKMTDMMEDLLKDLALCTIVWVTNVRFNTAS